MTQEKTIILTLIRVPSEPDSREGCVLDSAPEEFCENSGCVEGDNDYIYIFSSVKNEPA